MLNVNIICIGKLKEKYWHEACSEYIKRLRAFCNFKIIELDECKICDNPSAKQIESVIFNEGQKILSKITKGSYSIALCIEGSQISSEKLSNLLLETGIDGISTVNFIIGGSWGLSEEVKNSAKLKMSISKMTFPHQLARVILCEQIYRSFNIINGGKYHK